MRNLLALLLLVFASSSSLANCEYRLGHIVEKSYKRAVFYNKVHPEKPLGFSYAAYQHERDLESLENENLTKDDIQYKHKKAVIDVLASSRIEDFELVLSKDIFDGLLKLAQSGYAPSQMCVSYLYQFGLGTELSIVKAYAWAATANAQNPPFGKDRREGVASKLNWEQQSKAVQLAELFMKEFTDLYNNPSLVVLK